MRRACLVASLLVALLLPSPALAQKKVSCPDGDHYLIDVREIAIKYKATRVESTVNGLAALGFRVTVDQKTLQTAAVATQQMNEFIKALASVTTPAPSRGSSTSRP